MLSNAVMVNIGVNDFLTRDILIPVSEHDHFMQHRQAMDD